jgi:hypothetical protein
VVDRGAELQGRKLEGKLFWEIDVDNEFEAFVWTSNRSIDFQLPMEEIFFDSSHDPST